MKIRFLFLAIIIVLLIHSTELFSAYTITRDILCNGGSVGSSSTTYTMNDIIPDFVVGASISTQYNISVVYNEKKDSDSDGMPDQWENLYGLNSNSATGDNGADGDPDKDGQTNYQEYLADTDPNSGTSILRITSLSVVSGTGSTMQFPTSDIRSYYVYYSNDAYSNSTTWTQATTINGTGSTYSWTDDGTYTGVSPLDSSISHRYYKITPTFGGTFGPLSLSVETEECVNLTSTANVTASSEYNWNYRAQLAVDGVYGVWDSNEWASKGEMTPWIKLQWANAMQINKIVLYDRCNPIDHIQDAWLSFYYNGSLVKQIHIGMFPYGGGAKEVIFDTVTADIVKLQVTSGVGLNVGLSEIMVFYDTNLAVQQASNLALSSSVTASSEYSWNYRAGLATDGVYGAWDSNEWASRGEMTPWLKLTWPTAKQMNKIILYDRCNPIDHIEDAWLRFYLSGSLVKELHIGKFPYGGGAKEIIFGALEADAVKLEVTSGVGLNIGLSEIMVFYDTNLPAQQASNLALSSSVTASSEYNWNYRSQLAVDGVYGTWDNNEWASMGEMTPWLKLTWPSAKQMNKIILYDRCNPIDHIEDAWLRFYLSGSLVKEIHIGKFPYGGGAKEIIFNTVTADSVKLEVTSGVGLNIGLSEIMVFNE